MSMEGETTIPEKTINVAKITVHPKYEVVLNPWTGFPMPPFLDNDIALVELAEEVDLTMYTPICLAGSSVTESGDGTAAGWGSTGSNDLSPSCPLTLADYPNILQVTYF